MIDLIIAQIQNQVGAVDYIMRGAITVIGGLVIWGIKTMYDDKKKVSRDISEIRLQAALTNKDIETSQKFNEHLDLQYSSSFTKIEEGLSTILKDVAWMKVEIGIMRKK